MSKTRYAMHYQCKDCGEMRLVWLELGLEEHGEDHKPVPFSILCPECNGTHMYHVDWDADIELEKPREIMEDEDRFTNDPERDCGHYVPGSPELTGYHHHDQDGCSLCGGQMPDGRELVCIENMNREDHSHHLLTVTARPKDRMLVIRNLIRRRDGSSYKLSDAIPLKYCPECGRQIHE